MLRILIVSMLLISFVSVAQQTEQQETNESIIKKAEKLAEEQKRENERAINLAKKQKANKFINPTKQQLSEQQSLINAGLKQAEELAKQDDFLKMINTEKEKLQGIKTSNKGAGFVLPSYVEEARTERYMAQALAAGEEIQEGHGEIQDTANYPIVLISLSMPIEQIQNILSEAHKIGAGVAVRGLIDDDFQKTVIRLKEIAGEHQGGLLIDPTLFKRFDVKMVPTFILPIEPITPCTPEGCNTPKHVKATGSATIDFFLRMVERTGSEEEKLAAEKWIISRSETY